MMAGGGGSAVAGGPALHIPVLGRPAVDFLKVHDGGVYIDGTFGAGGYSRAVLAAADCKVIGIDRDQSAIALGADLVEQARGRLTLIEDRFSNLDAIARDAGYDAVDSVKSVMRARARGPSLKHAQTRTSRVRERLRTLSRRSCVHARTISIRRLVHFRHCASS